MPTAREIASRFWLDTFSKADLERAIQAAIADEREACAAKAREYAAHYPAGSDGRNTFALLAEWIENRARGA